MTEQAKPKGPQSVVERSIEERRRHRRVQMALGARLFIPATQEEVVCAITDVSAGGGAIECEKSDVPRGPIVLYIENIGRLEGMIVRPIPGGFAIRFSCSTQKRERIVEQLMLAMNQDLVSEMDFRRNDRTPTSGLTRFTRANGDLVRCEVVDLSLTGVSVKTSVHPPIGEHVLIGQMAGRVARHHGEGVAIEFLRSPTEQAAQADRPITRDVPE